MNLEKAQEIGNLMLKPDRTIRITSFSRQEDKTPEDEGWVVFVTVPESYEITEIGDLFDLTGEFYVATNPVQGYNTSYLIKSQRPKFS